MKRHATAERMKALIPLLEYFRTAAHDRRCSSKDIVQAIGEECGISHATVWNWYERYQRGGYAALADRDRSDKGSSVYFHRHARARSILIQAIVVDQVNAKAALRLIRASVANPPSYGTVLAERRRIFANVDRLFEENSR